MAEETKAKKAPKAEAGEATAEVTAEKAAPKAASKSKKAAAEAQGVAPAAAAAPAPLAAAAAPTAADLLGDDPNAKKIIRAKGAKNITVGVAHVKATFNNTQVTITDLQETSSDGAPQAEWVSKDLARAQPSRLSRRLKTLLVRQCLMECARLRSVSVVRVQVASPRFGHCRQSVLRSRSLRT